MISYVFDMCNIYILDPKVRESSLILAPARSKYHFNLLSKPFDFKPE